MVQASPQTTNPTTAKAKLMNIDEVSLTLLRSCPMENAWLMNIKQMAVTFGFYRPMLEYELFNIKIKAFSVLK